MRSTLLFAAAACLAFSASGAFADPSTASTAPGQPASPAPAAAATASQVATNSPTASQAVDPNEVICKTEAPATGTRLGARRVCQTQRQWEDQQHQAQDQLMRDQSQSGVPKSGG